MHGNIPSIPEAQWRTKVKTGAYLDIDRGTCRPITRRLNGLALGEERRWIFRGPSGRETRDEERDDVYSSVV